MPLQTPRAQRESTSCSTHKEGKQRIKHSRRGGWLYACTSQGYILHLKEYVGAESLSQRYFFLAELVAQSPTMEVVIHDDACHLRKFVERRKNDSEAAARLAHPRIRYIVDRMHSKGHVDPWCLENCVAKAPGNEQYIADVNTSVCEQTFSRLGRHKFTIRWMDRLTSAMLLHEMAEVRNADWLQRHPVE